MKQPACYRADIDGLRSIAVLSVVFYHFGVWPFSGGFTGVDVFFVISGYLITSILYREAMTTGRVSLLGFYDRRVRRILPALVFVVVCSLAAGYLLLLPDDYERLGFQAAASVTGLANFYFLFNTGYFDREADMLPLLHMWSLAVEEQYYIGWPILLTLIAKFFCSSRTLLSGVLCCIIASSFALAAYAVAVGNDSLAFYMIHTRAWQLALGALIVFIPGIRGRTLAELAAVIGILLIVYGVFALNAGDPFPGVNALYPSLGAALLIWQKDQTTIVARILLLRPAVFVGLISYSLYLWHWPLLVFFRIYANGAMPKGIEIVLLFVASVMLAIFSWAIIEKPFRHKGFSPFRSVLSGSGAVAAICAVGLLISTSKGLPTRLPSDAVHYANFIKYKMPSGRSKCTFAPETGASCKGTVRQPHVLIIGDSHASHFTSALVHAFPNVDFSIITASGCRPVLGSQGRATCVALMELAYKKYIPDTQFDAILISARWRNGQVELIPASVRYLQQHTDQVILFGQTMEWKDSLPSILARNYLPRREASMQSLSRYDRMRLVDHKIRDLIEDIQIQYYSVLDVICPNGECLVTTDGNAPIQRDYGHLTYEGALYVVENLKRRGLNFDNADMHIKSSAVKE